MIHHLLTWLYYYLAFVVGLGAGIVVGYGIRGEVYEYRKREL